MKVESLLVPWHHVMLTYQWEQCSKVELGFGEKKKLAQPFLKDSFKVSRFDIINIYYLDKEN